MLGPYQMANFILENHTALDPDETRDLKNLLDDPYSGAMLSTQRLHEIAVLYHEAVGIVKHLRKSPPMGAQT